MKKISMFAGVAAMVAVGGCKDEGAMTRAPGDPQVVRQEFPDSPISEQAQQQPPEMVQQTGEIPPQGAAIERGEPEMEAQGPDFAAQGPGIGVDVDPLIVERCEGVETTRTFFETDQTELQEQDRQLLRKIAECFGDGELQGQSIAIVGFADPRGEFGYNYELGRRRAQSVARFLAQEGLSDDRMETLSVGEALSSPVGETGYPFERRVAIRLVQDEQPARQQPAQQRGTQPQQGTQPSQEGAQQEGTQQEGTQQEGAQQEGTQQEGTQQEGMEQQERMQQEREQQEREQQERMQQERIQQEREQQERMQQERIQQEREQQEGMEQQERMQQEREQQEQMQQERERGMQEQPEGVQPDERPLPEPGPDETDVDVNIDVDEPTGR